MEAERPTTSEAWRGTIGLIIPSRHTANPEYEVRYLLPEGVGLICQRVLLDTRLPVTEALEEMHKSLHEAAYILHDEVDIISYGCTFGSFFKGIAYEHAAVQLIKKASGLKAITAAGAVADAIRFLGANNVLLISPYPPEGNMLLERYLKEDQHIGIHFIYEMVELDKTRTPQQNFRLVLDAYQASPPGVDAVFFSCGATRLVEFIPLLEAELGVPVFSTNLCNVWKCLQMLGIHRPIHNKGKLLEIPR